MPINSKQKGKRGELQWAKFCRDQGYPNARRTAQFCGNTGDAADVVGVPGIHMEVKYTDRLRLYDFLAQAVRDSEAAKKAAIPIVAYRATDCKWTVIMRAEDWFTLYREWEAGQNFPPEEGSDGNPEETD